MLRLIMALDNSDDIRHAYFTRNDILNKHVLDNKKSIKKRAGIVWELLLSKVASLSLATPDKVQEKISTMNVLLQHVIKNWEPSGQGDSGIDVVNDSD